MDKINAQKEFFDKLKKDLTQLKNVDQIRFGKYAYSELIRFNMPEVKDKINFQNNLSNLMNFELNNLENLRTIPQLPHFLWFRNKNKSMDFADAVKLYIPLDENHLCEGAKQLFTYMDKEDILTESKIRFKGEVTLDNIVVRVKDIKTAERVINFINNNEYIKEGLLDPNPFLINKDNIGITMDGNESYNGKTATMMAYYIWNNKDNLDNISIDTYRHYLEEKTEELDKNTKETGNYDLKNIVDILLMSVNDNTNDYEEFKKLANKIQGKDIKFADKKISILNEASTATINKHGIKQLMFAIEQAIYVKNFSSFTRFDKEDITKENNLRAKLISNIEPTEILDLIKIYLDDKDIYYDDRLDEILYLYGKNIDREYNEEEILVKGIR